MLTETEIKELHAELETTMLTDPEIPPEEKIVLKPLLAILRDLHVKVHKISEM